MDLIAKSVELELSERINEKVFYLQNLATHWNTHKFERAIWQAEADFTVNHLRIYQTIGFVSQSGKIIWQTSVPNFTTQLDLSSAFQKWLPSSSELRAKQSLVRMIVDDSALGKKSFLLIYTPLLIENKFAGFLIAIVDFKSIATVLSDIKNIYQINLYADGKIIEIEPKRPRYNCGLELPKQQLNLLSVNRWELEICSQKRSLKATTIYFSVLILGIGLSLAIIIPILIKNWQTNQKYNLKLLKLNQNLALEIKQRQQAQLDLTHLNAELEQRVFQRTNQFQQINQQLQAEINNRERTELALAESEALYRQMIETAEEGIWILDVENRTYFVNQKMAIMLGYTVEEMIDRSILEFMENSWQKRYLNNLQQSRQGINEQHDFKFKRKDNSPLWVIISTSAIFDNCGNYSGTLRMITDISDRKLTEEQLIVSLREKELLLKEINHRLKNNLLLISTLIDLQIERLEEPTTIQLFEDTQQRIHSMALIQEKLFQSPNLAKVNFGSYLRNLAESITYSYNFEQRNIELKLSLDSIELNLETANPCGLIVNELLVNAVKHAFPAGRSGTIWLKLEKTQENLILLRVEDNGIGFIDNFNFQQSESLGLHLIHTLTKQIEGKLQLERMAKTSFTLIFSELNYQKRI